MAKKDNLTLGQIRKRMWSVPSYDTSNAKKTGDFIEGIPVYQNPDGMRILKREDVEMRMSDAERQEAVQELKAAQNYGSPSSSDSLASKDVLTPEEYRRDRLDNTLETMQKNSEEMTKKYGADWRNSSPYGMSVGNDKDSVLPLYFTPAWPVAAGMNTTNAVQNYNRGSRTEYVWDKDSQQSVPVNVPYDGKNLAVDMALEWAVPGAMHVGGNAIAKYGLKGAVPGLMRDIRAIPENVSNTVTRTVSNTLDRAGNVDVRWFTPKLSEARLDYYYEPSVPLRDALKYQRDRFKFTLANPENKPRFWVDYNSYTDVPLSLKESAKVSTDIFRDLSSSKAIDIPEDTFYSPILTESEAASTKNIVKDFISDSEWIKKNADSAAKNLKEAFPNESDKWITDIIDSPYRDQLLPLLNKDLMLGNLHPNVNPEEYIKDFLSKVYGDLYRGVRIKGADIHNPNFHPDDLYKEGMNYHGYNQNAPNLNTSEYRIARGYAAGTAPLRSLPLTLEDAKKIDEISRVQPTIVVNGRIWHSPHVGTTPAVYKYTPKLDGVIDPSSLTRSLENVNKMFDDSNIRIVGDYIGRESHPFFYENEKAMNLSEFLPFVDKRPFYINSKRSISDGSLRNVYTIFEARDPSKPYSFDMFDITPMDPLQPVPNSLEKQGTILPLLYDRQGNFAK